MFVQGEEAAKNWNQTKQLTHKFIIGLPVFYCLSPCLFLVYCFGRIGFGILHRFDIIKQCTAKGGCGTANNDIYEDIFVGTRRKSDDG